jgi:hypothetical protein
VHVELAIKAGSFADFKSPFRDIYGWQEAINEAKRLKPAGYDLAVSNWSEGSRVWFYANEPIYVADDRYDQFDIWYKANPIGRNYLFLQTKSSKQKVEYKYKCDETKNLGSFDAKLNSGIVEGFDFVTCKNFQGLK